MANTFRGRRGRRDSPHSFVLLLTLIVVITAATSIQRARTERGNVPLFYADAALSTANHHAAERGRSILLSRREMLDQTGRNLWSSAHCASSIMSTQLLQLLLMPSESRALVPSSSAINQKEREVDLSNFRYSDSWTGTSLSLQSLEEATRTSWTKNQPGYTEQCCWPMGRWPDPLLRRPASPVEKRLLGSSALKRAAYLLEETARTNEAVGLAAQQCGVDARMVFLDLSPPSISLQPTSVANINGRNAQNAILDESNSSRGLVMVNPKIVQRSAETEMRVWNEHCLVLPPNFVATVLRDDWIVVEYQRTEQTNDHYHQVRLSGELARAAQHELDHDAGILTLDHVSLDEMLDDTMRSLELKGHDERQLQAYARDVVVERMGGQV